MIAQNRGDSIVEVVVAVAIISMVALALIRVTTVALNNATFAKNQATATKYAQEAIEEVRLIREANGSVFFDNTALCQSSSLSPLPGNFVRQKTCTLNASIMQVLVVISWDDNTGTHHSELETYLTKWQ
ncbi:MAG: hypothetical protein ABH807_02280 [Candidatus Shapirobacteria bacterium]